MPTPALSLSTTPALESDAQAVLVVLPTLSEHEPDLTAWPGLREGLDALGFAGAAGSTARVPLPDREKAVYVVGVGSDPDAAAYREATGAGVRSAGQVESLAIEAPAAGDDLLAAVLEGAGLGGYTFAGYKKAGGRTRAARVVVTARDERPDQAESAQAVVDAVALVKDLVATPADRLSPADLAARAQEEAADLPITVTVVEEDELEAEGFGGILGVGRGSARPPRFVRLDYSPADAAAHIAVVGKGITFDTGGLSLKPAASMVGMKYDMCGAATALAVVTAAAALGIDRRVTAYLCIADNMPSGDATRPGDVLTLLDGTTVEVLNTDAEGRLVLADGLVYASRENPDVIVDVATLTGAITIALGTRHVGVMGSDDAVAAYLRAADVAGELAWRLPLPQHMRDDLDSPIADLVNAKIGDPAGGSLFAGLFLEHFVGRIGEDDDSPRIPWVHLDIAGAGMNKGGAYGYTDKGATATTVRSLIEFARVYPAPDGSATS